MIEPDNLWVKIVFTKYRIPTLIFPTQRNLPRFQLHGNILMTLVLTQKWLVLDHWKWQND